MVSLVDNDDDPQRRGVVHLRMTIPIWMLMRVLIPWLWSYVGYMMTTMMMMMIVNIQIPVYDVSVFVSVVAAAADDTVVQWQQVCPAPVPSEHSPGTCGSSCVVSLSSSPTTTIAEENRGVVAAMLFVWTRRTVV